MTKMACVTNVQESSLIEQKQKLDLLFDLANTSWDLTVGQLLGRNDNQTRKDLDPPLFRKSCLKIAVVPVGREPDQG